jgi:hypothetical protein
MSVVRPEFGPTLPELLGPRVRALPRPLVWALAALAAAAVAALAWAVVRPAPGRETLVVHRPVAFNILAPTGLRRVAPRAGEVLRLETPAGAADPQTYAVRPLRLPAYRGDVSATLTLLSVALVDEMQRTIPGFVWRGDGKARINDSPGYQIVYQARDGARTFYGRRVLLMPGTPAPREGVDLDLRSARSPAVPTVDAVGANGLLKLPLRSFRFGTERP